MGTKDRSIVKVERVNPPLARVCANCERAIGKLEAPFLWKNNVVCGECIQKLSPMQPSAFPAYPAPPPPEHRRPYPAPVVVNNVVTNTVMHAPRWNRGVAMILSLLIPGLGQLYRGHIFSGLFWFIITAAGYFFFVIPGIILHFLCICSAASGSVYR